MGVCHCPEAAWIGHFRTPRPPSCQRLGGTLSPPDTRPLSRARRPWLAAFLQAGLCVGGLGYLYLGQVKKAVVTFLWAGALLGMDAFAGNRGLLEDGVVVSWSLVSMVLAPIFFGLLLLTALDAWTLATRLKRGESVGRRETSVPVLKLLRI